MNGAGHKCYFSRNSLDGKFKSVRGGLVNEIEFTDEYAGYLNGLTGDEVKKAGEADGELLLDLVQKSLSKRSHA